MVKLVPVGKLVFLPCAHLCCQILLRKANQHRCAAQQQQQAPLNAIQYKMNARNALTGRTHLSVTKSASMNSHLTRRSAPGMCLVPTLAAVRFASEEYRVMESHHFVRITLLCQRRAPRSATCCACFLPAPGPCLLSLLKRMPVSCFRNM
jgi:hypothetical protein